MIRQEVPKQGPILTCPDTNTTLPTVSYRPKQNKQWLTLLKSLHTLAISKKTAVWNEGKDLGWFLRFLRVSISWSHSIFASISQIQYRKKICTFTPLHQQEHLNIRLYIGPTATQQNFHKQEPVKELTTKAHLQSSKNTRQKRSWNMEKVYVFHFHPISGFYQAK